MYFRHIYNIENPRNNEKTALLARFLDYGGGGN